MIIHTVDSYWIPNENKPKSKFEIKKKKIAKTLDLLI